MSWLTVYRQNKVLSGMEKFSSFNAFASLESGSVTHQTKYKSFSYECKREYIILFFSFVCFN